MAIDVLERTTPIPEKVPSPRAVSGHHASAMTFYMTADRTPFSLTMTKEHYISARHSRSNIIARVITNHNPIDKNAK